MQRGTPPDVIFSLLKIHTQHSKKPSPIPAGAFCFPKQGNGEGSARCAEGRCSAWRCCQVRGIFSHVREYPPWTSKRTRGVLPLDPAALAVCSSKSCGACRIGCGVRGFATGPCESIHVATAPYDREARMTVVRRRTACGGGFAALAAGGIAAFLFQQCSFL